VHQTMASTYLVAREGKGKRQPISKEGNKNFNSFVTNGDSVFCERVCISVWIDGHFGGKKMC